MLANQCFLGAKLNSLTICSFTFVSVHQTAAVATWVMYELAAHKEHIPTIREELFTLTDCNIDGIPNLSYEVLRRAKFLDSFIREVLRLKGDTVSLMRGTTRDVPLDGYTIPKGKPHRVCRRSESSYASYR